MKYLSRYLGILFSYLILLLLTGCAHQAIPTGFNNFEIQNSKKGLIIGTISFPNNAQKFDRYFFHLKSLGEKPSKNSTEINIDVRLPYSSNIKKVGNYTTYLFAIKRDPGRYEMDHVRLSTNYGYFEHIGWLSGYTIPFNVTEGEITYVGEILYNESAKDINSFIRLQDNYDRDLNFFKSINSKIDWNKAQKNTENKIIYK